MDDALFDVLPIEKRIQTEVRRDTAMMQPGIEAADYWPRPDYGRADLRRLGIPFGDASLWEVDSQVHGLRFVRIEVNDRGFHPLQSDEGGFLAEREQPGGEAPKARFFPTVYKFGQT